MYHIWRRREYGAVKAQVLVILVLLLALTGVYVLRKQQVKRRENKIREAKQREERQRAKITRVMLRPIESAKALPPDTLAYFSFPNLRVMREKLRESSMNKLYNEPTVKQFLSDVTEKLEEFKSKSEGKLGIGLDMAQKVLQGQISMAILKPAKPKGANRYVFLFDVCENRDQFADVAKTVISRLFPLGPAEENKPAQREEEVAYKGVSIRLRKSARYSLVYAYVNDTLVVSTKQDVLQDIINRVKGEGKPEEGAKPCLAASPAFKAVRKRVAGDNVKSVLSVYVSTKDVLDRYRSVIGAERAESMKRAGLYSIQALGYGAHFEKEEGSPHCGVKEVFFIYAPKAKRQGFASIFTDWPSGDKTLLKMVPSDALYCSVTKINPDALWKSVMQAIKAVNADIAESVQNFVELINREAGADIEKDLLASLGNEIATISLPEDRDKGRKATTMAILTLKNPEKAEAAIQKLLLAVVALKQPVPVRPTTETKPEGGKDKAPPQQQKFEFAPMSYKNNRIHFLTSTAASGLPVNPAYCITKDYLIITNGADAACVALDTLTSAGPFLVDNPDYKEVTGHMSAKNSAISYFDFKTGTRYIYDRAKTLGLENLAELGFPLDLSKLPDPRVFDKHFFGVATCFVTDDEGIAFESYSPLGSVGTVLGAVTMWGALLPQLNVKDVFIRWTCKHRLMEVGKGLREYAKEHQGNLPEPGKQPMELVKGKFTSKSAFYCPATGGEPGTFPDGMGYQFTILPYKISRLTDDSIVDPDTGQLVGMDHRLPIAWDKKGNHADGRHVLFLDGHVEFLTEDGFLRVIESPKM
ncbi:MAG: DUF3352 domain-containing protein [Planctomycetes bacterium]|nr:DUF3352 domain-containing protein [Planctomycetota bacterium]